MAQAGFTLFGDIGTCFYSGGHISAHFVTMSIVLLLSCRLYLIMYSCLISLGGHGPFLNNQSLDILPYVTKYL